MLTQLMNDALMLTSSCVSSKTSLVRALLPVPGGLAYTLAGRRVHSGILLTR